MASSTETWEECADSWRHSQTYKRNGTCNRLLKAGDALRDERAHILDDVLACINDNPGTTTGHVREVLHRYDSSIPLEPPDA